MHYKVLTFLTIFLSIASCKGDQQSEEDEMAPMHPAPQIVALNTKEGYSINPHLGDSIQPIINSLGDTIKTGVPVPVKGKVIDPNSVAIPKMIPAGKPKVIPTHLNVYKIPEDLTVIPVNKDSLKTFTPGVDTSSFVLVNSIGDTLPTGLPIPVKGKVVPCIQPKPVRALPPNMKDNASIYIQYLDVDQGMNSSKVWSILEDSRGNLWVGNFGRGVSRYDGESFTHFTEKEGLSNNNVRSILEDSHENIWFGTDGGMSMYNGETFTHFTEKEGLSNNNVRSILEDSHGNLWFGTWGGGVNKYNGETFTHFTQKEGLSSNIVISILEDSHGNLWFGTWGGGVCRYNGGNFTHFTEKDGLRNNVVISILEDSHGNLWFGTEGGGVCKYNGETFTHFTQNEGIGSNIVASILEDSHGNIWFGTFGGGVSMYNGETFTHFTQNEGLSNNNVRSIVEDSHGNLWFGTWGGGVSIFGGNTFTHFTEKEGLSNNLVYSIFEDSHGNIWFGTFGGGVSMYDGETFTHFTEKEGLSNNGVESILEDSHGNIWIGTKIGGVSRYDGETFTHFTDKEGLSNNWVLSILEDSYGNLWFGTHGGGVSMYNGETFTHFTEKEGLSNNLVYSIFEDSHGNIWISTFSAVSIYKDDKFTHFTEKEGLSVNWTYSIKEDRNGNLWFGSAHGGVSMYNGETFTHFTENEGLSNNIVWSILEDSTGNIWLSTEKGLNRLVPGPDSYSNARDSLSTSGLKEDSVLITYHNPDIHTYSLQDGLKGLDFYMNSSLLDSKNRIWWGSGKGLTMLNMKHFKTLVDPPTMQLNRIEINEQFTDYRNLNDRSGLQMKYNAVAKFYNYPLILELPYNRNHLTFHFSAIDWSAPHKIMYSYKMEGLDDRWSFPTLEAIANYRNIPHGSYTFKVRAIGAAKKWSKTFDYPFTITPPLWFTWWAYIIYGLILLTLVRLYRGFLIKREKIGADLRVKELEVNKMQELNLMKSRFFTNISHEFRTPLTLIQGPIEDLERDLPDLPVDKTRELLQFMKRNTARLQHLINQILDISKLETGKVKLRVSEGSLEQFVRNIILSFLPLAESKKIKYAFELHETSDVVFFDNDKLEKILTNLISNAFKYTPEGGKIRVNQQYDTSSSGYYPSHVLLVVTDTGRGIPQNKLDRIFDRFYQVSDSDSRDAEGTGLGLALTKELVDIYRGEISVDSLEGKGSSFRVKLPVSIDFFTEEERVTRSDSQDPKPEPGKPVQVQKESEGFDVEGYPNLTDKENKPVILIVEDNADLRDYISRNLENNYRILTAINGIIGLNKAKECIPDLIVSDLMMPEMDGMEMSKKLKKDERTNHIPLIILTAKVDRNSKLEGLETGADAYLIKPFDQEELHVRIKNLLEQRKRLREKFRKEFSADLENIETSPEDKLFKKVHDILKNHIDEPDYSIEQLAGELNLSRAQVFRKVLAVTGFSPNELLRNLRLKKAANLFQNGHNNIAQVGYQVGFNNPSYFTKCFNELFGMNPSLYIKKGN